MSEPREYTILVVDDEATLRESIAFDLRRKGFNVLEAENGTLAYQIVRSKPVNLVLSDIRMPGGDGLTLLDQIRSHDPTIPIVIFLTGFADISEEECLKRGVKAVVEKPFDRKKLLRHVYSSLGLPSVV